MHRQSLHYNGKNWVMVAIHWQQMGNCDITWAANTQSRENLFNKRAIVAKHRQQIGNDGKTQHYIGKNWIMVGLHKQQMGNCDNTGTITTIHWKELGYGVNTVATNVQL